jgi:hypothetical protein
MTTTTAPRVRTRQYLDGGFINVGETIELARWYRTGETIEFETVKGMFSRATKNKWILIDLDAGLVIRVPRDQWQMVIA